VWGEGSRGAIRGAAGGGGAVKASLQLLIKSTRKKSTLALLTRKPKPFVAFAMEGKKQQRN